MRRIAPSYILLLGLGLAACGRPHGERPVEFVARDAVCPAGGKTDPRRLLVTVDERGRLALNRIEIGTLDDVSVLAEKLEIVFADRERNGDHVREVIVERRGAVREDDLEKLLDAVSETRAAPVRVICDRREDCF